MDVSNGLPIRTSAILRLPENKRIIERKTGNSPLALAVEIYTIDLALNLIKANIIKPLETGARDSPHAMVWNKEVFLPAHEDVLALGDVFNKYRRPPAGLLGVGSKGREFGPMRQVRLVIGTPSVVLGHEAVLAANDFALEVGG